MNQLIEETAEFLGRIPPFQFLDAATLASIAKGVTLEYYPKGTIILSEGGAPSGQLSVIKKGAVKVYILSDDKKELIIDYRGEGDSFGFISLIGGGTARSSIAAVEDAICYQISRSAVLSLIDEQPSFAEYYMKDFLIKSIDRTYREMHKRTLLYGGGEKHLFTTTVGELVRKDALVVDAGLSIREAAAIMADKGTSSIVLTGPDGSPAGIITDRDLRTKVVAKGRDVAGPASGIMSSALVRVDAGDYCFEALLKMIRYGIHHLLVIDGGRLAGVVTNHDFMLLQGNSPVTLVRDIESRQDVDELSGVSAKTNGIVSLLLKEGAKARNITRIITEINDRLVRQALELTVRKHGAPPLPFCWVSYGSEGRKEQTFKTDQDNAIIYEDPKTEEERVAAESWFAAFAVDAVDALAACGFPRCPSGYMASSPKWRGPLKAWKDYFRAWIHNPTPDAVLSSLIFFDMRPLYGEARLVEELRGSYTAMLAKQEVFLGFMANSIIRNRPPVGFFREFVVDKSGEHKDMLNIKIKGVTPIVDLVRLFALEKGIEATSTLERLDALKGVHSIAAEYAGEIEHAFDFMTLLRVQHQFERIEAGAPPDNFIDPNGLGGMERKALREAFRLVTELQNLVIERYKQMIW